MQIKRISQSIEEFVHVSCTLIDLNMLQYNRVLDCYWNRISLFTCCRYGFARLHNACGCIVINNGYNLDGVYAKNSAFSFQNYEDDRQLVRRYSEGTDVPNQELTAYGSIIMDIQEANEDALNYCDFLLRTTSIIGRRGMLMGNNDLQETLKLTYSSAYISSFAFLKLLLCQ